MKRFKNPMHRLRWKLTLSYTLVTVTAVLVLEILFLTAIVYFFNNSPIITSLVETQARQTSLQVKPFLIDPQGSRESLEQWLQERFSSSASGGAINFEVGPESDEEKLQIQLRQGDLVVVTGPAGELLATNSTADHPYLAPGVLFADPLDLVESRRLIEQALAGQAETISLPDSVGSTAIPVLRDDGTVLGVVYMRLSSISPGEPGVFLLESLQLLGASLFVFTLGAGAIGTFFGFITARTLTRRLKTVSMAADAWSQGDFSAFIRDHSRDELGELAIHLNRMAEQLQNLLETRQELATLEERNRLALELHDTVKQQVFAAGMQVGAARAILERNPEAALAPLEEAERLVRQAQKELTGLIRELRPAELEGKGLVQALREYVKGWSQQCSIQSDVRVQGERPLSLEIERALYRVAQEALSNVARHSGATAAGVELIIEGSNISLTISDDGDGFDIAGVNGKGIGLSSMAERLEALGGSLQIESGHEKGTRLTARCTIEAGGTA